MGTDPGYVWMTNTGTGPIAVPNREVESKLKRGWKRIDSQKEPSKPAAKVKPKKE